MKQRYYLKILIQANNQAKTMRLRNDELYFVEINHFTEF